MGQMHIPTASKDGLSETIMPTEDSTVATKNCTQDSSTPSTFWVK